MANTFKAILLHFGEAPVSEIAPAQAAKFAALGKLDREPTYEEVLAICNEAADTASPFAMMCMYEVVNLVSMKELANALGARGE